MSAITADGQTAKRMDDQNGSGYHATEATNGPLWKSPSGMISPAVRFDGTNDLLTASVTLTSLISASSASMFAAFRLLGDGSNVGSMWDNTLIAGDNDGWFGLYVKTVAGVHTLYGYNYDTNTDAASLTISQNVNYVAVVTHVLGAVALDLHWDGGSSSSSAASGNTGGTSTPFRIGGNLRSGKYLNCEIGEVSTYSAAVTGTAYDDNVNAMKADWVTAAAANRFMLSPPGARPASASGNVNWLLRP